MQYSSPVASPTVLELPPNPGHTGTVLSSWYCAFHFGVTCSFEGSQICRERNLLYSPLTSFYWPLMLNFNKFSWKDSCWQQRKPKCSAATDDEKSVSLRLLCQCGSTKPTRSFLQHQETSPFCVWLPKRHCSKRINSWQMDQEAGVGDLSHCRHLPGLVWDGYGGCPLWSCWAMFPCFPPAFCLAPQLTTLPVPHSSSCSYWSL